MKSRVDNLKQKSLHSDRNFPSHQHKKKDTLSK